MPISFDSALGIHQQALALRASRTELLASNIANAETPGYKAKDIDFASLLNTSVQRTADGSYTHQPSNALTTTNPRHLQFNSQQHAEELLYRVPNQSSLDGNTVDPHMEKSAFADNAMRYEASLTFLSGKFRGMIAALKGE